MVEIAAMDKDTKEAAFQKWLKSRQTRKTGSDAKKLTLKNLIKTNQAEFDKLLKTVKPTNKVSESVLTQAEKAAAYDALMGKKVTRQGKGSVKKGAQKALIAAHKAEYNKNLKINGGTVKED